MTAGWQSLLESGIRAVKSRKGETARALLEEAFSLAPGERAVRYWLGNALRLCERPAEAESMFRELLGQDPGDVETVFALAYLLREQGRPQDAAHVLLSLANLRSADLDTLLKAAGFLRDGNSHDAAIQIMKQALELRPEDAGLHFKQARLYQAVGAFDSALAHLRQALALEPGLGGAWLSLAELQRFSDHSAADWRMIVDAAGRKLGAEADMCVAFAHAKGLDDLEEWSSAWREYRRGNRLMDAAQPWNRGAWTTWLADNLTHRSPVVPVPQESDRHPIYIVGMLRSGTTLLEQLLERHSKIHGRGELNFLAHLTSGKTPGNPSPAATQKLAQELWTHLSLDGPPDHHYIDKNPLNFRFIGFLLSVLPESKIIHVRRDGRDSCLSCFFHLFQHPDTGFCRRLDDLVEFYRGYRHLMTHWEELAPDRILSVDYSALVGATRTTLETAMNFLGLGWEEGMTEAKTEQRPVRTASAWQARQPLHQLSVGRWKNYYNQAPDFFDTLAAIDVEFDRAIGPPEQPQGTC